MNSESELLEMAARAAGIFDAWPKPDYDIEIDDAGVYCYGMGKSLSWNPLENDGDALRLAVKLGLRIEQDWFHPAHGYHPDNGKARVFSVYSLEQIGSFNLWFKEEFSGDPEAATRRAIVRAAAEIGRNMP